MPSCTALVLSGGSGSRFGSDIPKQYQILAGKSILRRAVECFLRHPQVDAVRVVVRDGDEDLYRAAIVDLPVLLPVTGGDTRQASTLNGLESLTGDPPDLVLIHDGARPFPSHALIDGVIGALETHSGAIPAIPVSDTLKRISPDRMIEDTVDRSALVRAQTPQGFRFEEILAAHRKASGREFTDDAMIAAEAGLSVIQTDGDEDNLKITTQGDIARAERILGMGGMIFRTGSGFDVHSFGPGDHVILGGVRIDHDQGLVGHSDADALLHALTDAILGAIAEGDIGTHFPPSDPQWAGADSAVFLRHAAEMVSARGGEISGLDATIICERPKIGPHRDAIRNRIAEILDLPLERISIKATTTEQLGFTGRKEGLAAQAIATVMLPSGR